MSNHRYWRVSNMVTPSGNLGLAECEFRATIGGSDIIPSGGAFAGSYFGAGYEPAKAIDEDTTTQWVNGGTGSYIYFDYGAGGIALPKQLKITARNDFGGGGAQAPTSFNIDKSDDGTTWTLVESGTFPAFAQGQTQLYNLTSVDVTAQIYANQLRTLAVIKETTPNIYANQLRTVAAFRGTTPNILADQLRAVAVVSGRVGQPALVSWTFTLDGHDFYALRLGDNITLVYDQNTQQWAEWGEDLPLPGGQIDTNGRWTLSTGLNWQGIGALAYSDGCDVVAGDDTFGAIYAFDPGYDQDYKAQDGSISSYHRVAQGQLITSGRDAVPIWGVRLAGSVGEQWTGALVNVELQGSDDMGNTYNSYGILQAPQTNFGFRLDWNSLGSMYNPGRIFKLIDDGAMIRVDSLEAYDRDK